MLKIRSKLANIVHFIHHQFCTLYLFPKHIHTWLAEQFRKFHPSFHQSVTKHWAFGYKITIFDEKIFLLKELNIKIRKY